MVHHEDDKSTRSKREKANARERSRMQGQNAVLARLLLCLPLRSCASGGSKSARLSKIEVLRLATNYIAALRRLLATPPSLAGAHPVEVQEAFLRHLSVGLGPHTIMQLTADHLFPVEYLSIAQPLISVNRSVPTGIRVHISSREQPHTFAKRVERVQYGSVRYPPPYIE